ncbi:GNAT family N-acetyltransferase [Staphylococcus simulans]|uniref:GNAT family N-acetyltransferase n=1 Tax=Staphylococcus simulans TaxID=1286 RepID=UPI0021D338BF|nr:GNAT family protein [Staphylococcus simulans]UXR35747.1 GNAT family N-acetyltransferase [Staphylococcus simulans]UXR38300.1 GNAT family N-acetyltransferase [Staphylococcus simulans]
MQFEYLTETTERLEVRPMNTEDYEQWVKGYAGRAMPQSPFDEGCLEISHYSKAWFQRLIAQQQALIQSDDTYVFGVFRKADGVHLGNFNLVTLARQHFQWAECGYAIHNQFWRQGYAYEAFTAIFKIAKRLKYHRLEAHVHPGNHASIALLKKCGFEYECTRTQFIFENGEWTDRLVYYINLNDTPPLHSTSF